MSENINEERILSALGKVDKRYILEAEQAVEIKVRSGWMKWCTLAACVCIIFSGVLMGRSAYRTYMTESSYISIDVNPSLEFCLNKYNKVIDVCAYNEDGQKVAEALDVKNKSYQEAIQILLENETFQSYLTDESDLTFTIVSEYEEEIRAEIERCSKNYGVSQEIHCADYETHNEAVENHCSTGKYAAYQELAEYDEDITVEECLEMKMHELNERLEECKKKYQDFHNSSEQTQSHNHSEAHH